MEVKGGRGLRTDGGVRMDGGYAGTDVLRTDRGFTDEWRLQADGGYGRTEVTDGRRLRTDGGVRMDGGYAGTHVLRTDGGFTDGWRLQADGGYGRTEVMYRRRLRTDGGYRRMEVTDGRRFSFIILGLLKIKTEWIGMNLSVLGLKENILTEYLSSFSGKGASDLQFVYDFVADFNGGVFL